MKQLLIGLLSGVLLLTACVQGEVITPIAITQESAVTPSPIPTGTNTFVPTATQTASITPLPTIPTFTPTFDVSTIVTVTPAPKAECPVENPSLKLPFSFDDEKIKPEEEILKFLNNGGSIKTILSVLPSDFYPDRVRSEDLTGDEIPELAYISYSGDAIYYIFTCAQGKYAIYQSEFSGWIVYFYGVFDMNLNRLPELIVISRSCSGGGCYRYYVLEWNGAAYTNLAPEVYADDVLDEKVVDINDDGVSELIVRSAPIPYYVSQPWREELHVFSWNGSTFIPLQVKRYQPRYRFQAIQDADLAVTLGEFDVALNLYKQVIFSDGLEWWSPQRQKFEEAKLDSLWHHTPTPSVGPPESKSEYPSLAAYAYYRIMLLYILQENESEAETIYNTLRHKFGNDPYGQHYVEMATEFWEAYQATHKIYNGCAAAIQYASANHKVLWPLGSHYHGSQSHTYVPADVCPFR